MLRRLVGPAGAVTAALCVGLVFFAPHEASQTEKAGAVLTTAATKVATAEIAEGKTLFDQTCISCHGALAQGSALAPNLEGVGSATVDLWVSSGWMPLATPTSQPIRKPALFSRQHTKDIAYYVASLSPGGPSIPKVDLSGSSVERGFAIFALNCAPCHTITGAGDALSNGLSAPPLHGVTTTQVAEAVMTGPGNMPRLIGNFTKPQLDDIIAYVTKDIEHPSSPGGIGLGGVGPVAEGFIGLFVGVGLCLLAALWIGERRPAEEAPKSGEGEEGEGHPDA